MPAIEVMVGRPVPLATVEGTKTITPLYGVPVMAPAESVGVMSPVVVKALLPIEVTVGRPAAVDGTKTTTALNGEPVAIPAEFVGVMTLVVVKARSPVEVIVGRAVPPGLTLAPLGLMLAPPAAVEGTKTTTALNGEPVAMPAEFVGVMRLVVVKARSPNEVIVGRAVLPGLTPAAVEGT